MDKPLRVGGVELPAWATAALKGTCLEMMHPDVEGAAKLIPIDTASCFLVGRHDGEFNVVIDHVTVSRRHALLVHKHDAVFLYDMSSNGSSINGVPVPKREYVELKFGDSLHFGEHPSTFTLTRLPASSGSAPATAKRRSTIVQHAPPNHAKEAASSPEAAETGSGRGRSTTPAAQGAGLDGSANPLMIHGLKLHVGSKGLEVRTV